MRHSETREPFTETTTTDGELKRIFWPTIRSLEDAQSPLKKAVGVALFIGAMNTASAVYDILFPGNATSLIADRAPSLLVGILFLFLAWGVYRQNRLASAGALLWYTLGVTTLWFYHKPVAVLFQIILLLWLIGGVRATFYMRKGLPISGDVPWFKKLFWPTTSLLGLVALVVVEFYTNGTILTRPIYKWTTKDIRGQEIASTQNDYQFSFKNTKLDWRQASNTDLENYKTQFNSDFKYVFFGYDGMLLTIFEEDYDTTKYSDTQIINSVLAAHKALSVQTEIIAVPAAITKHLISITTKEKLTSIICVFKSKNKLVTFRFTEYKLSDKAPINKATNWNDMEAITNSFKFLK